MLKFASDVKGVLIGYLQWTQYALRAHDDFGVEPWAKYGLFTNSQRSLLHYERKRMQYMYETGRKL